MRFKLDENLPVEAATLLRAADHDAATILDQEMGGSPDADLASVCRLEGRVLLTLDTDFADIRAYPPEAYSGLIVLRLRRQDKPHVLAVLRRLLALPVPETIAGQLWIVEEDRVRIRDS